jgi:peroxiredoxin
MTELATGTPAPEFELRDQHGQKVRLASFRGRRSVLLVFFPHAFSSVCSNELHQLQAAWPALDRDVELLAISSDPMYALRAFGDAENLEFPLLSDFWPHGAVASAYGVFDDQLGCSRRSSFLVDERGDLAWFVHNSMPDARSLDDYRAAVDSLAGKESPRLRL